VSDRGDIIEVITRLFVGTDKRDWDAVRGCFTGRVHFDMTSLAGGEPADLTPQQITDGWDAGLKPIAHVHHQAGNFLVSIHPSETEADAFCYAVAYHHNETTRIFVGSYDFHLVKAHAEWKIDRFRFNLKFVDGDVELEKD
jgi:SnoaL-like protein